MERIKRIDIQLVNSCNLTCKGCISLSDFPRKGYYTTKQLQLDLENWSKVLVPEVVTLFGGEPLIHPELFECIKIIRTHWPNCVIRLITNGLLLDRYKVDDWYSISNFEMQISYHRQQDREKLNNLVKKICQPGKWKVAKNKKTYVFMTLENQKQKFEIWLSHFKDFVPPYDFSEGRPGPCNSDPAQAHGICGSPNTPVLLNGKIYKCPPVGNLINMLGNWLDYQGLTPSDNIQEFISNIGSPESVCSGCPDNTDSAYDHFDPKNVPLAKTKML